jgi:hypothetical protein
MALGSMANNINAAKSKVRKPENTQQEKDADCAAAVGARCR